MKVVRNLCGVVLSAMLWLAAQACAETPSLDRVSALKREFHRSASIPFPEDNPFSAGKAALGRMLFFEPLLSGSRSHSCASCHNPGLSWGDGLARATGDGGAAMALRAPTLLDLAWAPVLGWDGKFPDIEAVTFAAITGRANMNLAEPEAIARLAAIPGYGRAFLNVFGDEGITRRRIELALATYERTIVSDEAAFDRWIEGDEAAINDDAKRGFALFTGRAGCSGCHKGWAFTDGSFHDVGTAQGDDIGRARLFPSSRKLRYAFRVPTLRDVARRAPYMHDGSVPTLAATIDLYDRGGIARPSRSTLIKPLGLTADEKADLIAFLQTLSSRPELVPVPVLPR